MRPKPPAPEADWAWFLDIDGTLAIIAPTPSAVIVDDVMLRLISALHARTNGAVALVSGRSIRDIDLLFPGMALPVAGQHGTERRDAFGKTTQHGTRSEPLRAMHDAMAAIEQRYEGLFLEDKGLSLALHYRRVPSLEPCVLHDVRDMHARLGIGFHLQLGKCVVEIVPAGINKGTAVQEFMAEPPFRGRVPAFLGDDITDEHAFLTVNELDGHSIKVGPASSNARYRLPDVAAVQRWLASLPLLPEPAFGGGDTSP